MVPWPQAYSQAGEFQESVQIKVKAVGTDFLKMSGACVPGEVFVLPKMFGTYSSFLRMGCLWCCDG